MSIVVLGSARSSPGVTTLSVALASWLENSVVVEADPDGGVLAVRYGLGREPGLVSLAADRSGTPDLLLAHAQRLPGGLPVVVGPESAERTSHLWRVASDDISESLSSFAGTAIVDVGRLRPSSPTLHLTTRASTVVVVARPVAEELIAAADRIGSLSAAGIPVGVVLLGDRPYRPDEVVVEFGWDLLGVVATDSRAAGALSGTGGSQRVLARSAFMRSARDLAHTLTDRLDIRPAGVGAAHDRDVDAVEVAT